MGLFMASLRQFVRHRRSRPKTREPHAYAISSAVPKSPKPKTVWASLLWTGFGQSRPNWAPVGRWFGHLPKGTVFHDDIARSAAIPNENAIG